MKEKLTTFNISDLHINDPRIPVTEKLASLDAVLTQTFLEQIDMLIIAGDIFDRPMLISDSNTSNVLSWIERLLTRCSVANTAIRILEGTPSHDRCQSELFVIVNGWIKNKAELRYVKGLEIEIYKGISIFYIPDEYGTSALATHQELIREMNKLGLSKCDIGVMHGFFEYQLPEIVSSRGFDSEAFNELVNHYIVIGHVHNSVRNRLILPPGSWGADRFRDSFDKGGWLCRLYEDPRHDSFTRILNKMARRFILLEGNKDPDAKIVDLLEPFLPIRETDSIRLLPGSVAQQNEFTEMSEHIKASSWEMRTKVKEVKKERKVVGSLLPPINSTTIMELVNEELNETNAELRTRILEALGVIVNAIGGVKQ